MAYIKANLGGAAAPITPTVVGFAYHTDAYSWSANDVDGHYAHGTGSLSFTDGTYFSAFNGTMGAGSILITSKIDGLHVAGEYGMHNTANQVAVNSIDTVINNGESVTLPRGSLGGSIDLFGASVVCYLMQ